MPCTIEKWRLQIGLTLNLGVVATLLSSFFAGTKMYSRVGLVSLGL